MLNEDSIERTLIRLLLSSSSCGWCQAPRPWVQHTDHKQRHSLMILLCLLVHSAHSRHTGLPSAALNSREGQPSTTSRWPESSKVARNHIIISTNLNQFFLQPSHSHTPVTASSGFATPTRSSSPRFQFRVLKLFSERFQAVPLSWCPLRVRVQLIGHARNNI